MNHPPLSADDLYRLVLVGDARISRDRQTVVYVLKTLDREANEYRSSLYLWRDGAARRLTAGPDDSAPRWAPDGRRLAFLRRIRPDKPQIYLLDLDGGEPLRLTEETFGAGPPVWSPDGDALAFAVRIPTVPPPPPDEERPGPTRVTERARYKLDGVGFVDDRRLHLCVVEPADRQVRQITHGDCNDSQPAWSPDGAHLAFAADRDPEWDLRAASDIWIVPRAGGEPRRLTDGRGFWHSPVFSPDGAALAYVGFAKTEDETPSYYNSLWTAARDGSGATDLLAGRDLEIGDTLSSDWSTAGDGSPQWDAAGIYFLASEHGRTQLFRQSDGLQRLTDGPHHVMDFSVSPGAIAVTLADTTHPAEVALLPAGADRALPERVTEHNAALLAERTVVRPEPLPFTGAEGATIDAWVMRPPELPEGTTAPAVVYIHGGPVAAYGETFFHEFQVLAGAGLGVFYCNPHGSSSCGQPFQVSIIGGWGNLDAQDVLAGAEAAAALPWVDGHRLGVAGGSYGGYLSNWLVSHSDRFAAAVSERAICNMVSQGGTSDWASTRGERMGATPEGDPDKLWRMSPLRYVSAVRTPTLIIHSERDDRCPMEQAEQWFAALKRLRVPVRFIRFPEESHGLSRGGKPSRRHERLGYIAGWFRTRL